MPTLAGAPSGATQISVPPAMPGAPLVTASTPPARYQLGGEIARGGMGRVVDATDITLGRTVAFKEALTSDVDSLRRFDRETQITAKLEHPSIVPVHDAGRSSNGQPFYVMRKVSGRPLERLVAHAETLNQRLELIPHIIATAQAIAHAHARGIVHRDIKPSNILVGELGETVVIDWGLAKVIGEPEDAVTARPLVDLGDALKTRAGIVYGTPGFMAPEQLRGAPVDEGCDVYALGATLYHLLSRTPPHYAKTADEMMKAAVAAPPTPIRELVDGVPPELATIVDKALAHDPRVRYQDARALAEDLQRFLTGQLVASHHYSPREKIRRFIRRNRALSIAVAAFVVLGAVAITNIVIQKHRADTAAELAREQEALARQAAEAERTRADELTLSQARFFVDYNPTKAVAMLKPLAGSPASKKKYWREIRAIAAGAHAAGVAWEYPVSPHTRSLQLSKDGLRALSAGDDGVIRLHDLAKHTTRAVIDLHGAAAARFADDERRIVAWLDTKLAIIDAATGRARELAPQAPITALDAIGMTAYWTDRDGALWKLDLAGATPESLAVPERVRSLAASPDGRWLALTGSEHLLLYDRTQPAAPISQITRGDTHQL
ncbi:MAG TPA: serine/threonine-protein kinase, partial [Kofleriaceae bacterium]|nr:serine/threonine-protein kinase [Kofleriaceae bacterium]